MFYRLLKISAWARRHPKLAILVITINQFIFILFSFYLGKVLYQSGYILGRPFLFVGFMLIIDGIFLFPHRDELKEVFVNPRKLWVKLIASMLITLGSMILIMGYAGKKEFKTEDSQGLITRAYAIETAPHLTVTQSQLERDYATKFIVKFEPKHKTKALGFWRTLALIFISLFLLAILGFTSLLYCGGLCAGNLIYLGFLTLDTLLFYWGVVYWLLNGPLTKRNRYNLGIVTGILLYALMFVMPLFIEGEIDIVDSSLPLHMLIVNFLVAIILFFWGHNLPLFRFKPKTKKEVEVETE